MTKGRFDDKNCKRIVMMYEGIEASSRQAPACWLLTLAFNALCMYMTYLVCDHKVQWLRTMFLFVMVLQFLAAGGCVAYWIGVAIGRTRLLTPFVILGQLVAFGVTILFLGVAFICESGEDICYFFAGGLAIGLCVWYALTWHWLCVDVENGCYRGHNHFPPKRIPSLLFLLAIGSLSLVGGRHSGGIIGFFPLEVRSLFLAYICVLANVFLCKVICVTMVYCYLVVHCEKPEDQSEHP